MFFKLCFNGRRPGAYGQFFNGIVLLFGVLGRDIVPMYGYLLFVTGPYDSKLNVHLQG